MKDQSPFCSTSMSMAVALERMGEDWRYCTLVLRRSDGCINADSPEACQRLIADCRCEKVDAARSLRQSTAAFNVTGSCKHVTRDMYCHWTFA